MDWSTLPNWLSGVGTPAAVIAGFFLHYKDRHHKVEPIFDVDMTIPLIESHGIASQIHLENVGHGSAFDVHVAVTVKPPQQAKKRAWRWRRIPNDHMYGTDGRHLG